MNVGQLLKQRREEKGMTPEQVADSTKISLRHVLAMEENRFEELPSKAYAKGFLKLYARCVGVPQDEVVLRFETAGLSPVNRHSVTHAGIRPTEPVQAGPRYVPHAPTACGQPAAVHAPASKIAVKEKKEKRPLFDGVNFDLKFKLSGRTVFIIVAVLVTVLAAIFASR